jgi:hypothetical protein
MDDPAQLILSCFQALLVWYNIIVEDNDLPCGSNCFDNPHCNISNNKQHSSIYTTHSSLL